MIRNPTFLFVALASFLMAAGMCLVDWQNQQSQSGLIFEVVTKTEFDQDWPNSLQFEELRLRDSQDIGATGENSSGNDSVSSAQVDKNRYRLADVLITINDHTYPLSEDVWVDSEAPISNVAKRYLSRFQLVRLANEQAVVKGGVIETLQHAHTLASTPLFNLWLMDVYGSVEHGNAISHTAALENELWREMFISSHHARSWAVPPVVALMIGISSLLVGLNTFWSRGGWGVFSTTVLFVTPLLAAGPLLTTVGWHYFIPTILLSYLITVTVAASVSSRMRLRAPSEVKQRITKAGVVPAVALLVAVVTVISLSALLSVPADVMENANNSEADGRRIIAPALQLLSAGAGLAVFLTLLGIAYGYLVNSRFYVRNVLTGNKFSS